MKLLKFVILLLLFSVFVMSCDKKEDIAQTLDSPCAWKDEVKVPDGIELKKISSIAFEGSFKQIQFLNDEIGYILGGHRAGGFVDVFKTSDGGQTWIDLNLTIPKIPHNIFFLDENVGFISYFSENGGILKTTDGGVTWTEIAYPNIAGSLYHIQKDADGNLYSMTYGVNSGSSLVKSTNQGESWDVLLDSDDLYFSQYTFSFQIVENRIYLSGKDKQFVLTDLDGQVIKKIGAGLENIVDVKIIDENNIFVASNRKAVYSSDGGAHWKEIYDKGARIIDFWDSDTGLVILEKETCNDDVLRIDEAISYTQNRGVTWAEGAPISNLRLTFVNSQKMGGKNYNVLINKDLYRILKQ